MLMLWILGNIRKPLGIIRPYFSKIKDWKIILIINENLLLKVTEIAKTFNEHLFASNCKLTKPF